MRLSEGHAGTVSVSGSVIRRAVFTLRRYERLEGQELVLPLRRAAEIAAAGKDGVPALVYMDSGDRVRCVWVSEAV